VGENDPPIALVGMVGHMSIVQRLPCHSVGEFETMISFGSVPT
jgi:hypothetical protein